jgi:glycosyltransferase involved in cell wall biosynthesis
VQIALITETYPPEVNGVAMTLGRLVGGLGNRGHKVTVVRPRQRGEDAGGPRIHNAIDGNDQWLVSGLPIPFYQALRMGLPGIGMLRRRWSAHPPDIVHVATEGPLGFAALKAACSLGLPVSSSFHTNFHQYGGHYGLPFVRGLALRYLRWFHNQAARTLVPTDEMCAELARQGFRRLAVLSRGVDARLFSPAKRSEALRKNWCVAPTDPVVIYVGRIAAEKNLNLAVEAFLAMRSINPRARFVLVGDGPQRAGLAARYPDFVYAGMRRGEELASFYASADVFLFPSSTETFGNVVTEALASGLVVASYDYAAARQFVHPNRTGFLAKFGDRSEFLRMAREVMNRYGEWPTIRAAARVTAQTISWEVIVAHFEAVLATIISTA